MSRDEPAGAAGREYVRVRQGWPELRLRTGCDGWMRSDLRTPELLDSVASLLEEQGTSVTPLSVAWNRDVYLFRLKEPTRGVFVKRYYPTGGLDGLRTCLGWHKALAAWRIGQRLLRLGLPTATPVGVLRRRTAPWRVDHLLLTEGIPNAVSLADFVATALRPSSHARSDEQRQLSGRLLREVSSLLARLHRAGVYHGDFTARNIVLDAMTLRPYLLDLDAVRSTHGVSRRRRLKNLDELGRNFLDLGVCSPLDRARFLRTYLAETEPGYASLTAGRRRLLYHRWLVDVWRRTQFRLRKHGLSFEGPRGPRQAGSTREQEDDA